ncbi:hypothetical protein DFH05DRAFT_1465734 [Lentinula detonsa]|uniref:RING-type domain-containing protein n=1 Tax=Lentinula detonsa TaxID=2804962 RepID=A0A9W8PAB4_9AGAR|nr:hypothetical protein DFH05DRAFT_1465734 [Lentinula detonsa]
MATQDSEDDFDQMPDHIDFGAIGDDVWDAIQTQNQTTASPRFNIDSHSQPPRTSEGDSTVIVSEFVQGTSTSPDPAVEPRRANTPSIAYSSDDVEDLDDDFFQQLDEVENQIMNSARATAPPTMVPPEISNTLEASFNNVYDIGSPPMKRRRLEDCNESLASPTKKGKEKFQGDWSELLDEYDDEINCPICCDILVAAHLVNGCGHTLCGSCGYQWIVEKHRNTCPVCRANCHALTPLIPNIIVDNFVNKHLRVRAMLGDEDWQVGGSKLLEWQMRKDKWKNECEQRAKRLKKSPPIVIRPRVNSLVGQLAFMNDIFF